MKLRMKVEDFNYGDVVVKFFPKLLPKFAANFPKDSAAIRILTASAYIPEDILYGLCESIPQKEKNRVVMSLTDENKDRILELLNKDVGQKFGIKVSDLTVDEDLVIKIQVNDIDLMVLTDQVMPRLGDYSGDGLTGKIIPMLSKMPRKLWAGFLERISEEELTKISIYMLDHSENMVVDHLTKLMNRHGIRGSISSLHVET